MDPVVDEGLDDEQLEELAGELRALSRDLPRKIEVDPDDVEAGLARLVLVLVEFVRQLLEHQAVRRMKEGSLTDEEVERVGLALMRLQERMDELKEIFGLADDDLNLDLGPLGRLL